MMFQSWRLRASSVLVASVLACVAASATAAPWEVLEISETGTYARWYRPDSASSSEALPVIIFLHGSGSTPEAWFPQLQPEAELAGAVLLVPKSVSNYGWGVGKDQTTLALAFERLAAETTIDRSRVGLAGHSSGGAYAYVAGLGADLHVAGIFSLAAPFRTVLDTVDPTYSPPVRLYYGTEDPNYGVLDPLTDMLDRLGIPHQQQVSVGYGHSSWPPGTLSDGFAFLLAQRYPGPCEPTPTRLCLRRGRFAVELTWRDHQGEVGVGHLVPGRSDDSGLLWFFDEANWELLVKVIDGCGYNGHYWVFGSAATDVEYRLVVTDTQTGQDAVYSNALGQRAAAINDTSAFATCP